MKRAARIDANQVGIITYLRECGCKVLHLHQLKNCCDALVGYEGKLFLIEIKDGSKPASQRKLTEGEQKFFKEWEGYPLYKVESVKDCLNILNSMNPDRPGSLSYENRKLDEHFDSLKHCNAVAPMRTQCRQCEEPSMPNSTLCGACFRKLEEEF